MKALDKFCLFFLEVYSLSIAFLIVILQCYCIQCVSPLLAYLKAMVTRTLEELYLGQDATFRVSVILHFIFKLRKRSLTLKYLFLFLSILKSDSVFSI